MIEYEQAWKELYVAMPEKGLHMSAEESQYKPLCFTNYRPHYNPKGLLDVLILGKPKGFTQVDRSVHGDNRYGYKDDRPYYEASGPEKEISFRISNVRSGAVRVCGYDRKESLMHAQFFLDPAYPFPKDKPNAGNEICVVVAFFGSICVDRECLPLIEIEYVPTEKRYELQKHIYMQDECTRLPDIPIGEQDHVLTIKTKPDGRPVSVTHVIIF